MSLFDSPNADAYTVDMAQTSRGPQLGFQDAFVASWQAQTRVQSLLGVEQAFRDVEQRQIEKMRKAGLDAPLSLDEGESSPFMTQFRQGRYSAAAQSIVDGGGWYTDELVKERDDRIKRLQESHPELGLKTYGEMFKDVQEQGQETLKRAALPTTLGGTIGGFLGGAAGSLNPVSDPLNFASFIYTAPMGGPGVLGRAAVQGAAQGVTEAGNIAIGPDNKGLITGVPSTPAEELARVGMAAAGGAGGQLVGEAIGAGVRRMATGKWFADLPSEKLPTREIPPARPMDDLTPHVEQMEPGRPLTDYPNFEAFARSQGYDLGNPYGPSRQAALRHAADVEYAARQLDRWDGPAAHEIAARTDTALPPDVQPGVRYDGAYQRYIDRLENTHDIARRLDGDLFAVYDKLEQQRAEVRASIERTNTLPDMRPNAARPDVQADFAAWKAKTAQELRLEFQRIDYQMRDMAPLVSRVYAAAEKEWRSTPINFDTLDFLKGLEQRSGFRYRGEGEPSLTERPMKLPRHSPATTEAIERSVQLQKAVDVNRGRPINAPKFQEWFKGSKIVDKEGKPLVVYHGTTADFQHFSNSRLGEATGAPSAGEAHFFTPDGHLASEYAYRPNVYDETPVIRELNKLTLGVYGKMNDGLLKLLGMDTRAEKHGRVVPSHLDMKNPYVHDMEGREFRDASYYSIIRKAKAEGHDGVIIKNTYDPGFVPDKASERVAEAYQLSDRKTDIYAVFDEKQIANALSLDERFKEAAPNYAPETLWQRLSPEQESKLRPGSHDAVDRAKIVLDDNAKMLGDKIDTFMKDVRSAVGGEEKGKTGDNAVDTLTLPDGLTLHLDKDTMINADGREVSVREYLRDMDLDQHSLDAVRTCSLPS